MRLELKNESFLDINEATLRPFGSVSGKIKFMQNNGKILSLVLRKSCVDSLVWKLVSLMNFIIPSLKCCKVVQTVGLLFNMFLDKVQVSLPLLV